MKVSGEVCIVLPCNGGVLSKMSKSHASFDFAIGSNGGGREASDPSDAGGKQDNNPSHTLGKRKTPFILKQVANISAPNRTDQNIF